MPLAEQKKELAATKQAGAPPATLVGKTDAEAIAYLASQKDKRAKLQTRILDLQKQREAYLAKDAGSKDAFDQTVVDSLRARGKDAGISVLSRRMTARERLLQLAPVHDHVQHAVLEQELRALEALGQLLADRLLDDARPGEADQGAGLRHVQVAEHRERGGDAAGGGIGQQADEGQPRLVEAARGPPRSWPSA